MVIGTFHKNTYIHFMSVVFKSSLRKFFMGIFEALMTEKEAKNL